MAPGPNASLAHLSGRGTKDKPSKEIYDFLHSWGRRVALTCCDRAWLQHTKQYGASAKMGVVSGTALVAYGVHGDD